MLKYQQNKELKKSKANSGKKHDGTHPLNNAANHLDGELKPLIDLRNDSESKDDLKV